MAETNIESLLNEQRVFPPTPEFLRLLGTVGQPTKDQLKVHVGKTIGSFAKPDEIRFTDALPKTRSGKIMRRLLRDLASGTESVGDMTTLEDLSVLARLREHEE